MKIIQRTTEQEIYSDLCFLQEAFHHFSGSLTDFAKKLFDFGVCLTVLDETGKTPLGLVGFYANDTESRCGFATTLLVTASARGQGLGTALLEAAENWCIDCGMAWLRLEVRKDNLRAILLYEKLGYVKETETKETIYMKKAIGENHG